eukprot:Hpha_TRINITY_DN15018_c2_g1::TRINITY_DN15018_c2_g1_i1::g.124705::m.124705
MVTTAPQPTRTKAAPLQQGVTVRVAAAEIIKEEWGKMRRDDYDLDMARVAGKQGVILHQHPSGAFTVSFEGSEAGLPKGETLRFKFPPLALQAVDQVPVLKRVPRAQTQESPPRPPPAPEPPSPETPPESPMARRRLDSGLKPPPVAALPSAAQQMAKEDTRLLAMQEAEEADDREAEEELEMYIASPRNQEAPEPGEEEEEDEEAAFLAALAEEEAAEEAAFLAELDGDDSAGDSPRAESPPTS